MGIDDWSAVADENMAISGINIAEGCPAKNINNAFRQMMADIKVRAGTYPSDIPAIVDSIDDITEESLDGFYYIKTDDIEE